MTGTVIDNTTALLRRAGRWFLHSGIQGPHGGVARYYRSDVRQNAPVSTEITGYAASFLFWLYRETGAAEYLDGGLRAAHFLTRSAWDPKLELFPYEYPASEAGEHKPAYFFDSGIIVRALLDAWRATRQSEFLDIAALAGRGMLRDFRSPQAIYPILDLPARQPRPYGPRWSQNPGCYQLKSALAWVELSEATGDATMLEAYRNTLEQAVAGAGQFLHSEPDPLLLMDRLHAYLYFLEGLLPRAHEPVCAGALREGISQTAMHLNAIAETFARSDVYAQLLRIRLFAARLGCGAPDRHAIENEAGATASFQIHSSDPCVDGAFTFGSRRDQVMPFANPVSTAFCAQALHFLEQYRNERMEPDYHSLV